MEDRPRARRRDRVNDHSWRSSFRVADARRIGHRQRHDGRYADGADATDAAISGLRRLRARRAIDEPPAVHPRHRIIAKTQSSLRCALIVLAGAAFDRICRAGGRPATVSRGAAIDGQRRTRFDAQATSQLVALRASVPVDPFGLIARARGDLARLNTVLRELRLLPELGLDHDQRASHSIAEHSVIPERVAEGQGRGVQGQLQSRTPVSPRSHRDRGLVAGLRARQPRARSGGPAVAADVLAGGARLLTRSRTTAMHSPRWMRPWPTRIRTGKCLNLSFHVVTGPKVQIGEIRFEGLKRVHERLVRRRLLLHTGEPYSAIAVEKARKDLLTLGVFAAVSVRLGDAPDAAGRVPVTFQMSERKRHAVGLSAGYSSDLGGSAGVTWSDRNVLR